MAGASAPCQWAEPSGAQTKYPSPRRDPTTRRGRVAMERYERRPGCGPACRAGSGPRWYLRPVAATEGRKCMAAKTAVALVVLAAALSALVFAGSAVGAPGGN